MPIARYASAAVLGFVVLVGAMLLIRPLIFSVAPARGDTNYAVAAADDIGTAPVQRHLLLNGSHGLQGEQLNGGRVAIGVIVSRPVTGGVAVVNAWSPTAACVIDLAGDRLRDCAGSTWTFDGFPISAAQPLQRFPAAVQSGAIIVDFVHPIGPG